MINKSKQPQLAAIYVRVSSEHQAEKVSPEEQEIECRKLAEEMGLSIINVYRDTQKFRVGTRLFEPSGTRTDRPGFLQMLHDATDGKFDTLIAWREDRFYRGLKAMILFLEVIQESRINVFLARENFDQKMAPVKAWVGQLELDGMKERMTMGVKARLRAGKANTGQDRYGYCRVGEIIEVVEEEAKWVRQIFEWYINRVSIMDIRNRLIANDAPQKGSTKPRTIQWARTTIQGILKAAKDYATGIKIQTRDGEAFEIKTQPIISEDTYSQFLLVRKANKKHKANHMNRDYLLLGKLYCGCNRKWQARTNSYTRKKSNGEKIPRKTLYGAYYCPQEHKENIHPDCPRTIGVAKADAQAWKKIYDTLSEPEVLISAARRFIHEKREMHGDRLREQEKLQKDLAANDLERQYIITLARKKLIKESDLEKQLAALDLTEIEIRRKMALIGDVNELSEISDWEEKFREHLEDLRIGLESLNAAPQSDEERREQFELKRRFVQSVVDKVTINKERELQVWFRFNLLALGSQAENFRENKLAGTYSRTPKSPFSRHLRGACA
ncbi:MAG TPA: recombinase family protein [Brevefilum fermentans]|nr:recombinase family protein [Brevefilum fermentans]